MNHIPFTYERGKTEFNMRLAIPFQLNSPSFCVIKCAKATQINGQKRTKMKMECKMHAEKYLVIKNFDIFFYEQLNYY